ncbi:hypothetical protein ACFB49_19570 [Sphingomonas sp. DBB INV C78]
MLKLAALAGAIALAAPYGLSAQTTTPTDAAPAKSKTQSDVEDAAKKAGTIATQPVRDVGAVKQEIPPVLEKAQSDPYGMTGAANCTQITASLRELNDVLGPDLIGPGKKENRTGKLAEAGGKTLVNTIIPFRGLVREISGAAPAARRLNEAVDAGVARRGFLRGLHRAKGCRTAIG